jgi:hypothetical protein
MLTVTSPISFVNRQASEKARKRERERVVGVQKRRETDGLSSISWSLF